MCAFSFTFFSFSLFSSGVTLVGGGDNLIVGDTITIPADIVSGTSQWSSPLTYVVTDSDLVAAAETDLIYTIASGGTGYANGDVLFLDEIHELRKDLVVTLYRAMENKKVFVNGASKKTPYTIPLNNFTLIGATTDYHKLPKPLRDRFKLTLYFEFYREEHLELILKDRTRKLNWDCEEQVFSFMSKRSRGIPRVGLRILEASRRVARSENSDIITTKHLNRACSLEGLDSLGLNTTERQYLKILAEHNSPIRLNSLAMQLGTLSRNLSQVIEPYLFRTNLIFKNDKGRIITSKGLEHINNNPIL